MRQEYVSRHLRWCLTIGELVTCQAVDRELERIQVCLLCELEKLARQAALLMRAGAGASLGSPGAQAAASGVTSQPPLQADPRTVGSNARTLFTGIVFGLQARAVHLCIYSDTCPGVYATQT